MANIQLDYTDIIDIFKNQHIGLYKELDNKLSKIKSKKLIK